MCQPDQHNFDVLRQQGPMTVFFCRHCLQIEWRAIPLREPEPAQVMPSNEPNPEAQAAADSRERDKSRVAQFRQRVLERADDIASAIGQFLRGQFDPPPPAAEVSAALELLVANADELVRCCPVAGLVAETDLEILLAARVAALHRIQPDAIAKARAECDALISSTRRLLDSRADADILRRAATIIRDVRDAAQVVGDMESVANLDRVEADVAARLSQAE